MEGFLAECRISVVILVMFFGVCIHAFNFLFYYFIFIFKIRVCSDFRCIIYFVYDAYFN